MSRNKESSTFECSFGFLIEFETDNHIRIRCRPVFLGGFFLVTSSNVERYAKCVISCQLFCAIASSVGRNNGLLRALLGE